MKKIGVFLVGGENTGWALDTDLALTRKSLELVDSIELVSDIRRADVVHSVWEAPFLQFDHGRLDGRRVVCHASNDVFRLHETPHMIQANQVVGVWIAQATRLHDQFKQLKKKSIHIPYSVDVELFYARSDSEKSKHELRQKYGIPHGSFIISNFMRDTEGVDLSLPKEQKSPELFLQLLIELSKVSQKVRVLLAGPRRHWLRAKLEAYRVPVSFIGQLTDKDDISINILSPQTIRDLYHVSDLHVISSKWEGGPRSVLEAAATKTSVISTPVGISEDILPDNCIFRSFKEGFKLVVERTQGFPDSVLVNELHEKINKQYTPECNVKRFAEMYRNYEDIGVFSRGGGSGKSPRGKSIWYFSEKLKRMAGNRFSVLKKRVSVSLLSKEGKASTDIENHFMRSLEVALKRLGVHVLYNSIDDHTDICIQDFASWEPACNKKSNTQGSIPIIQIIGEPLAGLSEERKTETDKIFAFNSQFSSVTVFPSAYWYRKSINSGYNPVNPVIIHNSCDSNIFYPQKGRVESNSKDKKKIKIITSFLQEDDESISLYRWFDDNLDWSLFQLTCIGKTRKEFKNITQCNPPDTKLFAEQLRSQDIFLSVGRSVSDMMALIGAMCCGLPALYRNQGANSEIVGYGGVAFQDLRDIFGGLNKLISDLDVYRSLINLKSIDNIAKRYLAIIQDITENRMKYR